MYRARTHLSNLYSWQAMKQELSEAFAVYVNFASELEDESKQLLEKVEQACSHLNDLQAQVAALGRCLVEERERCRTERQKRKERARVYNVCIMANSQTGSGKTHATLGYQLLEEPSGLQQEAHQAEKPADGHTGEVSVIGVYNNEAYDLLARDDQGNAASQRRDVISTASGASQVTSLTYE
ncbi:kinesin-like protein KIF25 [Xenentodon cancila]